MSKMFSGEQKAKLTQLINEGIAVLQEVEDLISRLKRYCKSSSRRIRNQTSYLKKRLRSLKNQN
jgi:peptidoglycan hydrolase CwlO-like protein